MQVMGKQKEILDVTAGYRSMWFNKNHPNALYIDQRPECEPDQVADFTNIPYPNESFSLIVFDPPHIVQKSVYGGSELINRYGYLQAETWQPVLRAAFKELWRLLKPNGILLFKWANTHVQSNEIIKLAPVQPLFYQVTKVEGEKSSGSLHLKTLWFTFMKLEASVE